MTNQSRTIMLALGVALAAGGCGRARASAEPERAATTAAPLSLASATAADEQASSKVTRVVFVGKENACNCTRRTVDAGWAALQQALGTPPKLPVERLQIDTQADKVAPYRSQKPMMALPAIYFVDGKDRVVQLLQGEVSAAQIATVIGK